MRKLFCGCLFVALSWACALRCPAGQDVPVAGSAVADRTREILLDGKYLLFPVGNQAEVRRMEIVIDGTPVHRFDINLAAGEPDWWAFLDLSAHAGRTAEVTVRDLPGHSQGLAMVEAADSPRHLQPLYDEALRPQLRFSQMRGWSNNPNGLVYHAGEFHLFWQSNPFGPQWANMYWGHAVSKDLVHWVELPVALYPRTMALEHCFSGSAHVDDHDTGGWRTDAEKVMVAAFTDTGCGEALAISRDRGRTWHYIEENPVIKHRGRDPKLIWYEPAKHWVIAVYSEPDDRKVIDIHTSRDLKQWEFASRIDGFHECPELLELPVDGDPGNKRWVIFGADAQYMVGSFDGRRFTPEDGRRHRLHHEAYHASQCFNRVPGGRAIQVGRARIEMPGMPFNQAFSLPTELTLKTTGDGIRMFANPIPELEVLRGEPVSATVPSVTPEMPVQIETKGQLFDILAEIIPHHAKEIRLQVGATHVVYHVDSGQLNGMLLPLVNGRLRFRVVVDRPMYEVVGGDGAVYATAARPDGGREIHMVRLSVRGGAALLHELRIYPMRSIWARDR